MADVEHLRLRNTLFFVLKVQGDSIRRIARMMGVDRKTVRRGIADVKTRLPDPDRTEEDEDDLDE